tara:strand:+ start:1074 stop:1181 length:108 start_codon:yes stop_codon:yes gene_type:complete
VIGGTIDTPHGKAVVVFIALDEKTGQIELLLELVE